MRKKGSSKDETRKQIIEAVGRGFRKNGVDGIGVDGLAKLANVTSGAFYSHLGSKNKAFIVALEKGLDEVIEGISSFKESNSDNWIEDFARYYLSVDHQKNFECGCAMATLTSDVTRFGPDVQKIYEHKMDIIAESVSQSIKSNNNESSKAKAWAFLSILIGGLNIVRAINDKKLREQIAESVIVSAINTII